MARVNAKRRGKPIKPIAFKTPSWSTDLVHLVAHLSFDGRIDRYGCSYYNRSVSQVMHVKRLFERLLGVTPKRQLRSNGVWVVSCYNVQIAAWLGKRQQELLQVVRRHEMWQRQWLRALFDDEGHIHWSPHTRRVRASQDDEDVLRHARQFLAGIRIKSRLDLGARAVEITGRENLSEFKNRINFSPGIRVNASRKNGLWNRSFEKRTLLALAINSYKQNTAL